MIRHEVILRIDGLNDVEAEYMERLLRPLAEKFKGTSRASLSLITRDQRSDHAIHVGRKKIV